nr:PREDICTED: zinc transporter ZIP5 [Lepisosteus oculatus]
MPRPIKTTEWVWFLALVTPPTFLSSLFIGPTRGQELSNHVPAEEPHQGNGSEGAWDATDEGGSWRLSPLGEALEEQGYYLHRLFLQYGENETLSFTGLQSLLGSLGLGEVSVLEISHSGPQHRQRLAPSHSHPRPADRQEDQPSRHPQTQRLAHLDRSWLSKGADHVSVWQELPAGSTIEGQGGLQKSGMGVEHPGIATDIHPRAGGPGTSGKPAVFDHPTETHLHGNCLNVTQLLGNFGLGEESYITPAHFTFLCPALLYQIDSRVCIHHPEEEGRSSSEGGVSFLRALGWGSLALTVISLPSLLALGVVPILSPRHLRVLLCPLCALAVGTLCGDALLHLLPHAQQGSLSASELQDSVLKGLCALGGMYFLFLVESLLGVQRHRRAHRKNTKKREHSGSLQEGAPEREQLALQESQGQAEQGHAHSHGGPAQGNAGIASLVWMVIMGDGIHNLTDGLAIGAAFSQSVTGGLSTSLAVFCHELPHELGDLAVLLGASWPVRRVLVFSLLSAALGFLGLLGGAALSHHSSQLSPWVFAVTAGVFLYVALTDMVPEMLHGDHGPTDALTRLFLQHLGLLTGGALMLCIALFEDKIAIEPGAF